MKKAYSLLSNVVALVTTPVRVANDTPAREEGRTHVRHYGMREEWSILFFPNVVALVTTPGREAGVLTYATTLRAERAYSRTATTVCALRVLA